MNDQTLILYGTEDGTVYLVLNETDAKALAAAGLYCAALDRNQEWQSYYNEAVRDKAVCLLQGTGIYETIRDRDNQLARDLRGVAKTFKVLYLDNVWFEIPKNSSVSDMINALGADEAVRRIKVLDVESSIDPVFSADPLVDTLDGKVKTDHGTKRIILQNTAENYLQILRNSNHFANVRFNLLRRYPEKVVNGKRVQWTDDDDAEARTFIEKEYGIFNRQRYEDAFRTFQREREYHPVQEYIKNLAWDGQARCERFLRDWLLVEDTPYNRECSRLIFAGAINRAFNAGCKFDEVIVLIGNQGSGKSTICQWLALQEDFYASVKTISGQRGNEGIQGKWIVEIEELLAVLANDKQGTKTEENAKAFLSATVDYYRKPYDRRPTDTPRTNIFIGTTNRSNFLTDLTGNRRWYPVYIKADAHTLYQSKGKCQDYIKQCYAEMFQAFQNNDVLSDPVASTDLLKVIRAAQNYAEVEDWRVAVIEEYVQGMEKVCVRQIYQEALYPNMIREQTRKDSNEIAEILTHKLGFKASGKTERFGRYGKCKSYERVSGFIPADDVNFD